MLADVLIKKYDDHLPLYRQSEIFARHGIEISRKTLCNWVGLSALELEPIVIAMIIDLLKAPKIHTDDTTVPVQDPGAGKTKTGRFWVYHGLGKETPPIVVYDYSPNRNQEWPMQFLKGYCGYLQADAYGGYDALYDPKSGEYEIVEVGCWAHVRRKFFDIIQANKKTKKKSGLAYQAVKFIRQLYDVEDEAKEMTDEERKALRQKKAKPILEKIKAWLDENHPKLPPKGALAKAMQYALNQWDALTRYLEEGYLDIDNNRAERLIKPVTIGRKNWTFVGSDQGGRNAAIIYSLVETAKLNGLNPQHYLEDVLRRLPTQLMKNIHELLPYNWKPQTNIGAPDTS